MMRVARHTLAFVSGFLVALMISCGAGPKLRIYLSDPARLGMEYYDETSGQSGFVNYSETEKFICLNQPDANALLSYCGVKK